MSLAILGLLACSSEGDSVPPGTAGSAAVSTAGASATPAAGARAASAGASGRASSGAAGNADSADAGARASSGAAGAAGAAGDEGSGTSGASGSADAGSAGQDAGAAGSDAADAAMPEVDSAAAEDPLAACVSALKTRCEMREPAACSSVLTVDVGTLVKATEIQLGPYGAVMDQNVGQGFEVPVSSSESNCAAVAASFGEPQETTDNIVDLRDVDLALYTVYRPACMREGETYPVITWGNGTCGQTEGYGSLLRYVASHGYVVFAANSRYTGGNGAMSKALDFAEAANADAESVYFKRLDLEKIGAMGHSQGGGATVTAAEDPRIDSLIIWNATASAPKPFLAVSGDSDIAGATPASMARDVMQSGQPSAWLYYHMVPQTGSVSGHLTLMIQPERVVEAATAWWDYMLKGDATARDFFVGDGCGLCGKDAQFEYGQSALQ